MAKATKPIRALRAITFSISKGIVFGLFAIFITFLGRHHRDQDRPLRPFGHLRVFFRSADHRWTFTKGVGRGQQKREIGLPYAVLPRAHAPREGHRGSVELARHVLELVLYS